MWTRSARKEDGTFSVTVWDNDNAIYLHQDGFTNSRDAELAGEAAQREVLFGKPPLDDDLFNMSDDELIDLLFN